MLLCCSRLQISSLQTMTDIVRTPSFCYNIGQRLKEYLNEGFLQKALEIAD